MSGDEKKKKKNSQHGEKISDEEKKKKHSGVALPKKIRIKEVKDFFKPPKYTDETSSESEEEDLDEKRAKMRRTLGGMIAKK